MAVLLLVLAAVLRLLHHIAPAAIACPLHHAALCLIRLQLAAHRWQAARVAVTLVVDMAVAVMAVMVAVAMADVVKPARAISSIFSYHHSLTTLLIR